MADNQFKDPIGEAIRLYFFYRAEAAARLALYQSEQADFIKSLISSGVAGAEAQLAAVEFKKVSTTYAAVKESHMLAEDAIKTARDLYEVEARSVATNATATRPATTSTSLMSMALSQMNDDEINIQSPKIDVDPGRAWKVGALLEGKCDL